MAFLGVDVTSPHFARPNNSGRLHVRFDDGTIAKIRTHLVLVVAPQPR
jgi:hypothetical protein